MLFSFHNTPILMQTCNGSNLESQFADMYNVCDRPGFSHWDVPLNINIPALVHPCNAALYAFCIA